MYLAQNSNSTKGYEGKANSHLRPEGGQATAIIRDILLISVSDISLLVLLSGIFYKLLYYSCKMKILLTPILADYLVLSGR